ncbi:MAG: hypothetical protein MJ078_08850, partial [Clostridia bacterium]|nr:hypothetical protein [Clostridia bacterium]
LYYVIFAPLEKLLSFRLTGNEDRFSFSAAAETYLLYHLDCTFKTLDFYKSLSDTVRQAEKWAEEVLKERDEPLPTTKKEE